MWLNGCSATVCTFVVSAHARSAACCAIMPLNTNRAAGLPSTSATLVSSVVTGSPEP
jgi:hypothetical protein